MCGIFGAVARQPGVDLADKAYFMGLHLQHRGQESCGVAYTNGSVVWVEKEEGLVSDVLVSNKVKKIKVRQPVMIIGQTRYSTSKGTSERNMPPQWLHTLRGRFALVHNGNIPDLETKKEALRREKIDISEEANDTEFMLKKIIFSAERIGSLQKAILEFMAAVPGSYSAAILSKNAVYLFRDPWGNRPLFVIETADSLVFASETCALKDYGTEIKEVKAGEVWKISFPTRVDSVEVSLVKVCPAHCIFESIYFSRPDSRTFRPKTEGDFRLQEGRSLARLFPVPDADFISCIPDSGTPAGQGFAFESQLPFFSLYVRNPYIRGRTFINPNPGDRLSYSKKKYHLMDWLLEKEYAPRGIIVLVDDSIERGITMQGKIEELYRAGAKEVHLRIAAPPAVAPCYYGIDIPTKEELIASSRTVEQVREHLGATSLCYLPIEELRHLVRQTGGNPDHYCYACFTKDYPIPIS